MATNPRAELSEYEECKILATYLQAMKIEFSHIPNETRTPSLGQRTKNRMVGVSSGIPDYLVIIPLSRVHNSHSFNTTNDLLVWIEMKKKKGGKVSPNQIKRINLLANCGCIVSVCNGFSEAKDFIESILRGKYRQ